MVRREELTGGFSARTRDRFELGAQAPAPHPAMTAVLTNGRRYGRAGTAAAPEAGHGVSRQLPDPIVRAIERPVEGPLPGRRGQGPRSALPRRIDTQRWLDDVTSAVLSGTYTNPGGSRVTLADWSQTWLAGQVHLKATGRSRVEGLVRNDTTPRWGSTKLRDVSLAEVAA